uniref:cell division cycle-associated protein 7 n=1 Tax=Myxine glutinosa TaxID=7769 RepID=UPI00358EA8AB
MHWSLVRDRVCRVRIMAAPNEQSQLAQLFSSDRDEKFHGFRSTELTSMEMSTSEDSSDSCSSNEDFQNRLGRTVQPQLPHNAGNGEFQGILKSDIARLNTMTVKSSSSMSEESSGDEEARKIIVSRPFMLRVALKPMSQELELHHSKAGPSLRSRTITRSGLAGKVEVDCGNRGRQKVAGTKRQADEDPERSDSDTEAEAKTDFLAQRALNVKANKAMLSLLMADLKSVPGLLASCPLPGSKKPTKPRRSACTPGEILRRNPERTSRPNTRSLSMDCFEMPPPLSLEERLCYKRKGSDDEDADEGQARRRQSRNVLTQTTPHKVRCVEDVTQQELNNIAISTHHKLYDKVNGSTCHQCRQKTSDTKTTCRNGNCVGVRGQFCGPCLRNRYGEDVREALLNPDWACPSCRGICNCSFCRQRNGRCATGILIHVAKFHGYNNVHNYLHSLQSQLDKEEED